MKIIAGNITPAVVIGLGIITLITTLTNPVHAQNDVRPIAPYVVKDTDNDSPGTNMVTRIVTIKAKVGGTQPIALQWKLDKGHGFEDIPGATNATYRIGNAQVSDAGFYSLFATNAAGRINTTPVPLIVSEGID
jgi:hypothetical protein